MSETQLEQMEKIGQEIQSVEEIPEETPVSHITPHMLASSLQPLSKMLARKLGIQSIELTDEDVADLEKALEPLNLSILERVSKYLPIILFSIGYLLRIFLEIREKRELEIVQRPPGKQNETDNQSRA